MTYMRAIVAFTKFDSRGVAIARCNGRIVGYVQRRPVKGYIAYLSANAGAPLALCEKLGDAKTEIRRALFKDERL